MGKRVFYRFAGGARGLLALFLYCILGYSAFGQSGGQYSIIWSTMDGGGGTSTGGNYVLKGTIGQADAGYHNGGPYELLGGFWVGGPLCIVDLADFAQLASYWLEGPCNADNNWCGGADLNRQDNVNVQDLTTLASQWLLACPFNWPL